MSAYNMAMLLLKILLGGIPLEIGSMMKVKEVVDLEFWHRRVHRIIGFFDDFHNECLSVGNLWQNFWNNGPIRQLLSWSHSWIQIGNEKKVGKKKSTQQEALMSMGTCIHNFPSISFSFNPHSLQYLEFHRSLPWNIVTLSAAWTNGLHRLQSISQYTKSD